MNGPSSPPTNRLRRLCAVIVLAIVGGSGTAGAQGGMGPGHPPVSGMSPHGGGMAGPESQSFVTADATLAVDTVRIEARDPAGKPIVGAEAALLVLQRSPAIGERRSEKHATTDEQGNATFPGLLGGSDHQYTATVQRDGATYTTEPFQLPPDQGMRAVVRVFPTTRRLEDAQVGAICFVGISPKDDFFQVDVTARIINVGRITWLPEGYRIALPSGYRAFVIGEEDAPVRFVETSGAAELVGAIPPGSHEASFRFQVLNPAQSFLPWEQRSSTAIDLALPPHVLRANVWADWAPGLRLTVAGFGEATMNQAPDGTPGWVTGWSANSTATALPSIPIRLDGFPARGSMPFLTVLGALALVGWGVWELFGRRRLTGPAAEDVANARERLLEELVAVERAYAAGTIGPNTRDQARRTLLEALARLEPTRSTTAPTTASAAASA
jgi:hypothetical protein